MVDRKSRDAFAELLTRFISGELSNFDFEKLTPNTKDRAILGMEHSLWCFYDDCKEHKMDGDHTFPEETEKTIARWILFLRTDQEYEWPDISYPGVRPIEHSLISKLFNGPKRERKFMHFGDYSVWPFFEVDSYENAKKNFERRQ